jgi:ribosomal protein L22
MSQGGRDAGTKIDQPSDQEGATGGPGKLGMEAGQAAEELGQQQAGQTASADPGRSGAAAEDAAEVQASEEDTPPQADGTAAAATGVDKAAAQAGATGAEAPAPARPKRGRARKAPAESAQPEAPAKQRQRRDNNPAGRVTVRAQAKFVRSSARKARLVADHVKGKDVEKARAILAFSPRSVAEDWRKLLESAIANAEHNHDLVGDDLRVLNATADEGPTLKRFRPRAMGRATRIRKRTSHLTITLTPKD